MGSRLVGRDRELRTLDGFLSPMSGTAELLVLSGGLGAGRSALLQEAAGAARREGFRVVEARGRKGEADLSGAGLVQVSAATGNGGAAAVG
ncbi:ATP-binding protein [Streptomyces sp. NPDC013157]|uniref:ATP-binding protein n=1 Tax=Streptomyces sp. NPDC013157 TaxID=3364861 RepID=UPI00368345FA